MSATIILRNVRIPTIIGVYDAEKLAPQALKLDLELRLKDQRGSLSDQLRDTVDYDEVIRALKEFGLKNNHELLEKFAYQAAQMLAQRFALQTVDLTVWKTIAAHAPIEIAVKVTLQSGENWQAREWGRWQEDALND